MELCLLDADTEDTWLRREALSHFLTHQCRLNEPFSVVSMVVLELAHEGHSLGDFLDDPCGAVNNSNSVLKVPDCVT